MHVTPKYNIPVSTIQRVRRPKKTRQFDQRVSVLTAPDWHGRSSSA
jgi:hypothetical protein